MVDDRGFTAPPRTEAVLESAEVPYKRGVRDYDPEDHNPLYALRLRRTGMVNREPCENCRPMEADGGHN